MSELKSPMTLKSHSALFSFGNLLAECGVSSAYAFFCRINVQMKITMNAIPHIIRLGNIGNRI